MRLGFFRRINLSDGTGDAFLYFVGQTPSLRDYDSPVQIIKETAGPAAQISSAHAPFCLFPAVHRTKEHHLHRRTLQGQGYCQDQREGAPGTKRLNFGDEVLPLTTFFNIPTFLV
jgi:hypothetical protein